LRSGVEIEGLVAIPAFADAFGYGLDVALGLSRRFGGLLANLLRALLLLRAGGECREERQDYGKGAISHKIHGVSFFRLSKMTTLAIGLAGVGVCAIPICSTAAFADGNARSLSRHPVK
jgi:hypothetical protein